jgi:hypothetical protein
VSFRKRYGLPEEAIRHIQSARGGCTKYVAISSSRGTPIHCLLCRTKKAPAKKPKSKEFVESDESDSDFEPPRKKACQTHVSSSPIPSTSGAPPQSHVSSSPRPSPLRRGLGSAGKGGKGLRVCLTPLPSCTDGDSSDEDRQEAKDQEERETEEEKTEDEHEEEKTPMGPDFGDLANEELEEGMVSKTLYLHLVIISYIIGRGIG